MRQSQQKNRMRGRGRKGPNPLSRTFESNGPDVKIRGTAAHIAEKYASLARDALSSGDTVMAENYLQHSEHYNRIVAAAAIAQGNRPEDGSNASYGRGPQPDIGGYNDDDGDDVSEMQHENPRHEQRHDQRHDQRQEPRHEQRGERRAERRQEDAEDDSPVANGAEPAARGNGEAGERPRFDRGRRRQRQAEPVEAANGNGNGKHETAEPEPVAVVPPRPARRTRANISSDASMLPESLVGRGAESPATETGAED